jgi:hypothetical protein
MIKRYEKKEKSKNQKTIFSDADREVIEKIQKLPENGKKPIFKKQFLSDGEDED